MKAYRLRGLPLWIFLLFFAFYCSVQAEVAAQEILKNNNNTVAVNIGVIYEEGNKLGKMGLNCIKLGLSDFYNSHQSYNTRIVLNIRVYPKDSGVGAAAAGM